MSYVRLDSNGVNQANVILFGANMKADEFPIKNIYKALNVIKPDALLV